jgi:uncharacterized protein DUF4258
MAGLRLVFTKHAEEMLVERAIDRSWIVATISNPESVEADPFRNGVMRAYRRIPEHGNRFLRVAYVRTDDLVKVLTAFFDRRRRS